MNQVQGRKNTKFYRGVLESAGLSEVAFFLKKAKQNLLYATLALEHTDFSSFDELTALQAKIVTLRDSIVSLSDDMEKAEQGLVDQVIRREYGGVESDESQLES